MPNCTECGAEFPATPGRWRCVECALVAIKASERACREVKRAIDARVLARACCEVCGAARVVAHHDDYSKPLAVRWLCRPHHLRHHAAERANARLRRAKP